MPTKPIVKPEWAENNQVDPISGQNNVVEPPGARKQFGFTRLEIPPRQWVNWLFRVLSQWVSYFEEVTDNLIADVGDAQGDIAQAELDLAIIENIQSQQSVRNVEVLPSADDSVEWRLMAWSSPLKSFLSIGDDKYQVSKNGLFWSVDDVPDDRDWRDLIWAGDRFIAVMGQTTPTATDDVFLETTDLQNFVYRQAPSTAWSMIRIAYSEPLDVLVAGANAGDAGQRFLRSTDKGETWTGVSGEAPGDSDAIRAVAWSGFLNKFVAITAEATRPIQMSEDGETWELVSGNFAGQNTSKLISIDSAEKLVSVGAGTNKIAYSSDGETWTFPSLNVDENLLRVEYSEELGIVYAIGGFDTDNSVIAYAFINDLDNWTSFTKNDLFLFGLAYSPELGLFVSSSLEGSDRIVRSL